MARHRVLAIIAFSAAIAGLSLALQAPSSFSPPAPNPYAGLPPVDLPYSLRCHNYGSGSCMHASFISVLRWQDLMHLAAWWRESYSGAEDVPGLAVKADRIRWLKYAFTTTGDERFLDWCSRTRRGAAIHFFPNHAITFCGYVNGQAVLLDNNHTAKLLKIPKQEFIRKWKGYGGFALTAVFDPAPPRPWKVNS